MSNVRLQSKPQLLGPYGAPISAQTANASQSAPAIGQQGLPITPGPSGPLLPGPKGPAPQKELTGAQLREVAGVGGAGISGPGHLAGTVMMKKLGVVNFGIAELVDKPVLVTANRGQRNEVFFELDLSAEQAAAVNGQDVEISGTIFKTSDTVGRIERAEVEATDGFPFGGYHEFAGRIEERNPLAIGGEAPPSGNYLILDRPIKVGGEDHRAVFVGRANVKPGDVVKLTGRLDKIEHGHVTNVGAYVIGLSGVTNQSAGEPKFDGEKFTDAQGKDMKAFSWDDPRIADEPAQLFVVDQGADKVWFGSNGGFLPQGVNPFGGFRGYRKIDNATNEERAKIGTDAQGHPFDKTTNQKFDLLHTVGQGPRVMDGMSTSWYRNPSNGTLYRFQNGGIAGFSNHLDQIVRPR
ncbi:MAG: hypothetical protein RIT81_06535 [Deltaproteobacteria bacterium]